MKSLDGNISTARLLRQLHSYWRPILLVHVIFTLLGFAILTPLFGLLLQGTLAMSGSAAVVDQDIARLLLSPLGMLAGVVLAAILMAITGLELGALQAIAQASKSQHHISAAAAVRCAFGHAFSLLRLTIGLTLRLIAFLLPYLAIVAWAIWANLSEHDINYYLSERPPEFVVVAGLVVGLGIIVAALVGRSLLGWSLALPLVMFDKVKPGQAFKVSESALQGKRGVCLKAFLRWMFMAALLTAIPFLFLKLGMDLVLTSGSSQLTTMALMLGLVGAVWSGLNFLVAAFNFAGFAFVIAEIYDTMSGGSSQQQLKSELASAAASGSHWNMGRVLGATLIIAVISAGTVFFMVRAVKMNDDVLIIAHRGAAGAAPENTLAAIRQAIQDDSDWVEIDVQESRDGHVIVVHDSDFMKLAGRAEKVWDTDLSAIQQIDVGSWFDPKFSNERVPTLEQVLQVIRDGDSSLVIELKYYGHDDALEQRVVEIVEAMDMSHRVVIMSLKLEGVHKLKKLRPGWTGGLLAATALGDITRLDADFLAVNQNMADAGFIRRAHKAGKTVFVWTVNDPLSLTHWMSMGVDGIITDEPALAKDIIAQRAQLSSMERLLLSAVLFFGKPEALKKYRDDSP